MSQARKHFYLFWFIASMAGYIWLLFIGRLKPEEIGTSYDVCLIHHFVHIPCPACGSTRSVLALMHGDIAGGFYWNPVGFLILASLIIMPLWIGIDLFLKKDTFFRFYILCEKTLRLRWVAIPAITLIILNWVWNIWKNV